MSEFIGEPERGAFLRRTRPELRNDSLGILGETIGRSNAETGIALGAPGATNTLYLGLIALRQGDVVSGMACFATVGGVDVSLFRLGLLAQDGTRLAVSGNRAVDLDNNTMVSVLLGTLGQPLTILADGGYFLAALAIAATTVPSLAGQVAADAGLSARATLGIASMAGITNPYPFVAVTGQTDIPASVSMSPNTTSNAIWLAAF